MVLPKDKTKQRHQTSLFLLREKLETCYTADIPSGTSQRQRIFVLARGGIDNALGASAHQAAKKFGPYCTTCSISVAGRNNGCLS